LRINATRREILGGKACNAPSIKWTRKAHLAAYVVIIRIRQAGGWCTGRE